MKRMAVLLVVLFFGIFFYAGAAFCDGAQCADDEKKCTLSESLNEQTTLSFNNLLGKDTSVKATGRLTESDNYIKVGAEKRELFDTPYFAGLDANVRRSYNEEFDLEGIGADLYAGRSITKYTKAILKYRYDSFDVSGTDQTSDIDFSRHDGSSSTSAVSLCLERTDVDDCFYPTAGTRAIATGEYALKSLGGDYNFSKYEAEAAYFVTPFLDITFGAHAMLGWMEDFGSSADVPFFERYFAGSNSTVRGFKWGRAGPISAQNTALGSEIMMVGNLEARLPIYKKLKGVIFFDTGRGFDRLDDFTHTDLRESAGIGLRYLTPWIAIRADYGVILDKKSDEDMGRLHLTLGMPF